MDVPYGHPYKYYHAQENYDLYASVTCLDASALCQCFVFFNYSFSTPNEVLLLQKFSCKFERDFEQ